MTPDAYIGARNRAYLIAHAALEVDGLADAIGQAEHAGAVGPLLDPTLARAKGRALEQDLGVMRAVSRFRAELKRIGVDATTSTPASA
jgi:hypothetical protein